MTAILSPGVPAHVLGEAPPQVPFTEISSRPVISIRAASTNPPRICSATGAQPAGDGGAGAAAGFQVAGEALDVGAAGSEQAHLVVLAPGRVLAQV
jgi:hypothetical protein